MKTKTINNKSKTRINNKSKTRRIKKGGMFFKSDPYKSCEDNKKDWMSVWKSRPGYEIYNPNMLYPGYWNLTGVPTEYGLLNSDGSPRKCNEPSNKDCFDNKRDWDYFWSKKPGHEMYNPFTLYEGNPYNEPVRNSLTDDYGEPKVCDGDMDFNKYIQSDEYKQNELKLITHTKRFDLGRTLNKLQHSKDKMYKTTNKQFKTFEPLYTVNKTEKAKYKTDYPLLELNEEEIVAQEQQEEAEQQQKQLQRVEKESTLKEVASIIVSHNTRIQCLLDAIIQNSSEDKIRFMNCAILKITVTPYSLQLSMVYEGNLSEREKSKINEERPYYVKENSSLPGHIVYPTSVYDYSVIKPLLKLPEIDKKFTFYIFRHGQGEHNVSSNIPAGILHSVTDTSITSDGNAQATLAGNKLYEYLTTQQQTIPTHLFVSDLIRTHQTLFAVLNAMQTPFEGPLIPVTRKPVVLPCASELPIKGVRGNCDQTTADAEIYKKLSAENYSKCKVNSDGTLHADCNPNVDWDTMYLPFYGGKVRGQEDTIVGTAKQLLYPLDKTNCRNTTMVALAIYYLTDPQFIDKHVENKIDMTDMAEIGEKSYDEQMKYYLAHRGGTRKLKRNRK